MTTLEQWDELLTCSPMSPQEALRSVRIKPAEIKAIQDDARADLLERIKTLGEALTQYQVALERCVGALRHSNVFLRDYCKGTILNTTHSVVSRLVRDAQDATTLATPLIEKGRKD